MSDRNQFVMVHGADEELLRLVDGELSAAETARLRGHLESCDGCRERLARIEATLAMAAERALKPMDAAGPAALLKARLAERADERKAGLGFRGWGLVRGFAVAVALALLTIAGISILRQETARRASAVAGMLPDPHFTPGATRAVALNEICRMDSDDVVRGVPAPLQEKVFEEYGIAHAPAEQFEVDYLITPGLGGADDVRNLWPEPHSNTQWNSYVKDQLEDRLHRMVCDREIPLGEAQREIAGNWIAAYKKYFHTEQPVSSSAKLVTF